jgi:hypothetical protein
MTKVRMSIKVLAYQKAMVKALRQVVGRNFINGVPQPYRAEPPFTQKHLLAGPSIGLIVLDEYRGQGDDYIAILATHHVGMHSVHITIVDDGENFIEYGEAAPLLTDPSAWEYIPEVCVPPGTHVRVHVTAIDHMGGIGRAWERKTMGEEDG